MHLTTLFFDVDDTLYPPSSGLWEVLRRRIEMYMIERMGIPREEIDPLRHELFTKYGTTLRGLQLTRGVDTLDYLAYVHDVPLADYITPDPAVREMLLNLPQRKLIFTNADRNHAQRVLEALNLTGCFEDIIDILDIAPYCKPQEEAFHIALRRAGEPDARTCLMVDDSPSNLAVARRQGFYTVLVGSSGPYACSDSCISRLADLASALPNGRPGA